MGHGRFRNSGGGGGNIKRSKQCKTACISMQIGRSAYRPDFSVTEETTDRDMAQLLLKELCVVAGPAIEKFPAAKTGKEECTGELLKAPTGGIGRKGVPEIIRRGLRVPEVETHHLSLPEVGTNGQDAFFSVEPDDIADEKIALRKMRFERVHHKAEKEGVLQKVLVAGVQRQEKIAQNCEWRLAFQFHEDIPVAFGNAHGLADGPASLGHQYIQGDVSGKGHADRPRTVTYRIKVEGVFAGLRGPGSKPPDFDGFGIGIIHPHQKIFNADRVRVRQNNKLGLFGRRNTDQVVPLPGTSIQAWKRTISDTEGGNGHIRQNRKRNSQSRMVFYFAIAPDHAASGTTQNDARA